MKKKRSAKQLANDKRLGRMAKAHAATRRKQSAATKKLLNGKLQKRKVAKRKVAKRKVARKNPHSKKYFQIALFNNYNNVIHFVGGISRGKIAHTGIREKALIFSSQKAALPYANLVPVKLKFDIAIVPSTMTLPQIRKDLGIKQKGK